MRDINALCRPDYGGQIAALSYRVQSVETRFASIETGQAGYSARLAALESKGSDWSGITNKPTTLAGYGIANAQPLDSDLTSLAAASTVGALYYRSAAGTWAPVTIGSNITFTAGTLSAASGGGGGSTGFSVSSGSPVSVTGTTAETVLATIAIPAGAIGPNGCVEIIALFSFTASTNSRVVRARLGGSEIWSATFTTAVSSNRVITGFQNTGLQSGQVSHTGTVTGVGSSAAALPRTSINTAQATSITLTGALATSSETITLESYLVRITYGA